tara:strand:- start:973 stop:1545 length:573 start_codon:yes stop_codon:yes gene_type:complete
MPRSLPLRRTGLFLALALLLSLAAAPPAAAQQLRAGSIVRLLNSLPQVAALGWTVDEGEGMAALPRVMQGDPFAAGVALLTKTGQLNQLKQIARRYGFADLATWRTTGDRVFRAAIAIEIPGQLAEMDAQLAVMKSQILAAEGLSAAQKSEMLNAFIRVRAALQGLAEQADPADIAAVQPFMPRIRQVLK